MDAEIIKSFDGIPFIKLTETQKLDISTSKEADHYQTNKNSARNITDDLNLPPSAVIWITPIVPSTLRYVEIYEGTQRHVTK